MTPQVDIAITRTRRWLETLAISLCGPGAGLLYQPADPFWLHGRMPWLLVVPLLCGVQHGLSHAAVSSCLLAALACVHEQSRGRLDPQLLSAWGLAALVMGAIAGQFRDVREEQRRRLHAQLAHMSECLDRAERTARVLKLSHARLSERLAARRWSLVGSVDEAAQRMRELRSRRELGEVLLDVLASQAMVQSASLYWMASTGLLPSAVASLGGAPASKRPHPLVQRALEHRRLVSVVDPAAAGAGGQGDDTVLAAVPVIASGGHVVGVIAIHHMPFMAFQAEQLRELFLIVGQLGDLMHGRLRELELRPDRAKALVTPPPLGSTQPMAARARSSQPPAAPGSITARISQRPS
jgi:hypothetical protein